MKDKLFPKKIPSGSVLGLNYSGMHDTTIALVSPEGEPLFAVSLERISRIKQDGRSPKALLDGVPWENISKVALSVERVYSPSDNRISRFHPAPLETPIKGDKSHADEFLQELNFIPVEKVFIPHHLCHAASTFWLSGFSEADCLVYDGGMSNEDWFGGVYTASRDRGIEPLDQFSAHNYSNIAHLYSAITAILGFTPLKHEGKITGLAGIGTPIKDCRKILEEWLHQPEILNGLVAWKNMYSQTAIPQLKANYERVQYFRNILARYSRDDIAATVQELAEEHVASILGEVIKQKGMSDNICLSGGLFANVKINQRVAELGFKNVFISPPMSDDGTALGAALQALSDGSKFDPQPTHSMFLGPSFSVNKITQHVKIKKIKYCTHENPEYEVAKLLANGKIVAIYQGRMEFGPRSLGNRSILASASDPAINKLLNNHLNRTEFMPFAPICLDVDADWLFDDIEKVRHAAEFMTVTVNCTAEMTSLCPAVVHCDGTARPQLVTKKTNPFIYQILTNYKQLTAKPVLVNTSFNVHEEPIVCTPEDAIKGFFESGLDALYIDGLLIKLSENREVESEYLRNKMKALHLNFAEAKIQREKSRVERDSERQQLEAQLVNQQVHSDATERELVDTQAQLSKTEEQTQWLQTELDKTHENVTTFSQKNGQLEAQLVNQQVHSDATERELVDTQAQLSTFKTQSQSLQNELNTAKAKIDELHQSNHHWWSMAEQQSHELKSVYASKSWRITKPLRLMWQGISILINVLLYIPKALIRIIWRGFKWPFKYLLSVLMRFILKRPKLKVRAKATLINYPRLQARLHRFASFRNITPSEAFVTPENVKEHENVLSAKPETTGNTSAELVADLSPNARKIYHDLKIAIENKNKDSH